MAEDNELDDFVAGLLEEDADEETSFSFQPIETSEQAGGGDRITSLRRENLRSAIDDYYTKLVKQEGEPQLGRDPSNFELVDGELRLKVYPNATIINSRTKAPLALRTIYTRSGPDAIRNGNGLGFIDWQYTATKRRLPSPIQAQFEKVADEANAAATTDDPDSINEFVDRIINDIDAAAAFPTGADTAAQTTETLPPDLLPLREIQGLNESLKTIRGAKAVQESKKVSLQQLLENLNGPEQPNERTKLSVKYRKPKISSERPRTALTPSTKNLGHRSAKFVIPYSASWIKTPP